jgi:hypothetical protein
VQKPEFVVVAFFVEAEMAMGEVAMEHIEWRFVSRIDKEAVELIQDLIAGGAGDRPIEGEFLTIGENFFDDDIRRGGAGSVRRKAGLEQGLESAQVFEGIAKAIGVIDAEATDLPLLDEGLNLVMGGFEDGGILHPESGEVGDVEEPSVVELFEADFPESQSVVLAIEQVRESRETRGDARPAIEAPDDPRKGLGVLAARATPRQEGFEGFWGDGKALAVVRDPEGTMLNEHAEFAAFEHTPEMIAKDREEDLVLQAGMG